ncbi:hypothetical protein V6Z11_A07G038800 [Gossypium hirsutum]
MDFHKEPTLHYRVNLLPLEIKDPGIQFMTGLKWFRIIVIQGCRI